MQLTRSAHGVIFGALLIAGLSMTSCHKQSQDDGSAKGLALKETPENRIEYARKLNIVDLLNPPQKEPACAEISHLYDLHTKTQEKWDDKTSDFSTQLKSAGIIPQFITSTVRTEWTVDYYYTNLVCIGDERTLPDTGERPSPVYKVPQAYQDGINPKSPRVNASRSDIDALRTCNNHVPNPRGLLAKMGRSKFKPDS